MNKITLKMDEANDLNFQFKIQGTSSEPNSGAPQFRFVVTEKDSPGKLGYVFFASSKESDGTITVAIPVLKDAFEEGKRYVGRVEVIIGTRLLVPTTLEIDFIKSLDVEVIPMIPEQSEEDKQKDAGKEAIGDIIEELDKAAAEPVKNVSRMSEVEMPKHGKVVTLTKGQLQTLLEKSRNVLKGGSLAAAASPKVQSPLKKSLKDMMKSALDEENKDD
jgi:hypothetical protein